MKRNKTVGVLVKWGQPGNVTVTVCYRPPSMPAPGWRERTHEHVDPFWAATMEWAAGQAGFDRVHSGMNHLLVEPSP